MKPRRLDQRTQGDSIIPLDTRQHRIQVTLDGSDLRDPDRGGGFAIRQPRFDLEPGTSRREGPFAGGCVKYGATQEYASALQKCGATARLVQLHFLDLDEPLNIQPNAMRGRAA